MDSASSPPFILWLSASVAVNGKSGTKRLHRGAHLALDLGVAVRAVFRDAVEHVGDQVADLAEFGDAEAACRAGRRAQPHARRHGVLLRIARDAVLVDG